MSFLNPCYIWRPVLMAQCGAKEFAQMELIRFWEERHHLRRWSIEPRRSALKQKLVRSSHIKEERDLVGDRAEVQGPDGCTAVRRWLGMKQTNTRKGECVKQVCGWSNSCVHKCQKQEQWDQSPELTRDADEHQESMWGQSWHSTHSCYLWGRCPLRTPVWVSAAPLLT